MCTLLIIDEHCEAKMTMGMCMQLLREAASRGGHMAHAAGTSPPPPTAPLGASGAETIKEFEVRLLSALNFLSVGALQTYSTLFPALLF